MRIDWNENAAKEIEREVKAVVMAAANEVAKSHDGRPESEVRSALISATRRRGLKFEPGDDMVETISKGEPPTFI